jgi:aconitate hydratase 2/2-methylisocitrate dehydratase
MSMGQVIELYPRQGVAKDHKTGEVLCNFKLKTDIILDEVRAGGRIPLIIGRGLTARARESLGLKPSTVFRLPEAPSLEKPKGYTLAQKMVGRACGTEGVLPGTYCEPRMTTVGSQDTTGPMTRDELKDLACLGFQADLVMQSFCHTAAYPKPVDVITHHTLPDFIRTRGGVSLRPGDGNMHTYIQCIHTCIYVIAHHTLPDFIRTHGGVSLRPGDGNISISLILIYPSIPIFNSYYYIADVTVRIS